VVSVCTPLLGNQGSSAAGHATPSTPVTCRPEAGDSEARRRANAAVGYIYCLGAAVDLSTYLSVLLLCRRDPRLQSAPSTTVSPSYIDAASTNSVSFRKTSSHTSLHPRSSLSVMHVQHYRSADMRRKLEVKASPGNCTAVYQLAFTKDMQIHHRTSCLSMYAIFSSAWHLRFDTISPSQLIYRP
jgi:hypothetical protein